MSDLPPAPTRTDTSPTNAGQPARDHNRPTQYLSETDLAELTQLRRELHSRPELSGAEAETAARLANLVETLGADEVVRDVGGHGVLAIWQGAAPGPCVLIRGDIDALPITETEGPAHRSTHPGVAHLCGHDGHATILVALARILSRRPPRHGRVVLAFQPAEETGEGAKSMLADERLAALAADYAFALHNFPGVPQGEASLMDGLVNCASVGLRFNATGRVSHASEPEKGLSPAATLGALVAPLERLSRGQTADEDFRLVTVTHLAVGAEAHGIAPGHGTLWASARARSDAGLAALCAEMEALARAACDDAGLALEMTAHEAFAACDNHPEATEILARAAEANGITLGQTGLPMRASEDFGRFGQAGAKAAMIFLGAGRDHPPLHAENYDFPDALIGPGAAIFAHAIEALTG